MNNINILYESKDYLAVNKPAGLLVHGDGKSNEETLADWFVERHPESQGVGESFFIEKDGRKIKINRSGVVHRLDKDTSGAVVLCKTDKSFKNLKTQFKKKKVQKIYKAFVYGEVKDQRGFIDRPIGRSPSDFRKRSAQRGRRGREREAQTVYRVLKKGESQGENLTYLEVRPQTGRTHQIRVHLKAINHPVICDKLYAESKKCILDFKRLALHAESIKFKDLNGEEVLAEAPLPEDFKEAIDRLRN